MAKAPVHNMQGKKVSDLELNDVVFGAKFNGPLIHQVYTGLRANLRRGTHSTKTRGEVAGGGRKPWRQKGTGSARHGSRRSPIWKGGSVTFGPRPRSYVQKLPRKMRHAAMRSVLSKRFSEGKMTIVDTFELKEFKTKAIVEFLNKLDIENRNTLLVVHHGGEGFDMESDIYKAVKSASNVPGLNIVDVDTVNVRELVDNYQVIFTQGAVENIQEVLA